MFIVFLEDEWKWLLKSQTGCYWESWLGERLPATCYSLLADAAAKPSASPVLCGEKWGREKRVPRENRGR